MQQQVPASPDVGSPSVASDDGPQSDDIPLSAHIILTLAFVTSSAFVAAVVASASDLLGIVGGFAGMTYAFGIPAEIGNTLRNRSRDGSMVIDWANSPAAFLSGWFGLFVIWSLRFCTLI